MITEYFVYNSEIFCGVFKIQMGVREEYKRDTFDIYGVRITVAYEQINRFLNLVYNKCS